MNHVYFLIMAGGEGTRFQPLSTSARPKQFINLVGKKSLIRQTFERLRYWDEVVVQNFYVATNARYINLVRSELPEVLIENIIGETAKKNTAPCIGFAAHVISSKDHEAVIVCLPSDHVVLDNNEFISVLKDGVDVAVRYEKLVTLGIKPLRPSPDYGYIERNEDAIHNGKHPAFSVKRFVEKPKEAAARNYIATGRYFWNSGIFVWTARTILEEIKNHLPELFGEIGRLKRSVDTAAMVGFFENSPSISIDYGVMEKSRNVSIIPCDFGWSDVGTWKSLKELADNGRVEISPEARRIMENGSP